MELWDLLDENRQKTGRTIERGKPLTQGQYHLVVFAMILNKNGDLLITRRSEQKTFPLHWEITGGAAVSGDDSESAVLREINEEVGLKFEMGNGQLVRRFKNPSGFSYFGDIWLFESDFSLADLSLQEEEVCDAKMVSYPELLSIMDQGDFVENQVVMETIIELMKSRRSKVSLAEDTDKQESKMQVSNCE